MSERDRVFLSYSHSDREAALNLRAQLERAGIGVFRDDESIRAGDLWLDWLQQAVDACGGFVVLVGRDGVARWVGAETQAALNRHFGPHDDAERLPIFPVLIDGAAPESLPAFLRLFQATSWNGADPLAAGLVEQIRARKLAANDRVAFEGCPFVGLASYRIDQAHLFFGRQKETLDALAYFDTRRGHAAVRWLEINGNSGSGKSSLMNAGLLPLVEQGWLWPRTTIAHWRRIGPMMPGAHPVGMLAEQLARTFSAEMADVRRLLEADDRGLADWLRGRKQDDTAFLLAIDQFEELFTVADPAERERLDRLLAVALGDADCPLFMVSTVRADFLDRLEELPRLVVVRNRVARPWTLPPIAADGLREIIVGPARLAGIDVSAVQEMIVAEAQDEPGALPLVENGLQWLWERREGDRLSGSLLTARGGLAGILSESADSLIDSLGRQRERALDLLFRLVNVDAEGRRHTRRRMPYAEAIAVAGGGETGRALVGRLAGERLPDGLPGHGPMRLITVTKGAEERAGRDGDGREVNLIHETLIRAKAPDAQGRRQPFWPTLWIYIEQHKDRATRRERLRLLAREWQERPALGRLVELAGWRDLFRFHGLDAPGSVEQRYLRWSNVSAAGRAVLLLAVLGIVGESLHWKITNELPQEAIWTRWVWKVGMVELPFPMLLAVPPDPSPTSLSFEMGTNGPPEERPKHRVTFPHAFAIGAAEITLAQYDAFSRATGRSSQSYSAAMRGKEVGDVWMHEDEEAARPVVNVDWSDASDYARWLGAMIGQNCRLPSEAEWEYACSTATMPEHLRPATFPADTWDLLHMDNFVYEWVEDCWHSSYENAPTDGRAWLDVNGGDCNLRATRGSRKAYFSDDRCSTRTSGDPAMPHNSVSFRVKCSSPSSGSAP